MTLHCIKRATLLLVTVLWLGASVMWTFRFPAPSIVARIGSLPFLWFGLSLVGFVIWLVAGNIYFWLWPPAKTVRVTKAKQRVTTNHCEV